MGFKHAKSQTDLAFYEKQLDTAATTSFLLLIFYSLYTWKGSFRIELTDAKSIPYPS